MVPGNQKMIRVWGGGIYENYAFYDACDELGVLVWQDFMFACGNYPCHPELLDTIAAEAVCNVRRIRHHPSIVIFAGNNEDYHVQESNGLTYNFADKDDKNWLSRTSRRVIFMRNCFPGWLLPGPFYSLPSGLTMG
ncbi:glycoside hydrolase superfamily [Lipomyces orientalis]|uniref:Glycoside hydrolase superfamily n=1 Tax=Lipomyces orientalis TaxID=1233043 RepID=A0ACC3TDP2_9ASCO